tara:strand:- start:770 stop:964 length:195 start_codon:yes stop_codon:yes gene_type:complete
VLVVVVLIFGTKKLGSLGGDLGKAVKGFKEGIKPDHPEITEKSENSNDDLKSEVIDTEITDKKG